MIRLALITILVTSFFIGCDDSGSPTGDKNSPPSIPSLPIPADSSINQPITSHLKWFCEDPDDDTLRYDVYFDSLSDPKLVSSNQIEYTYEPDTLKSCTTYYWVIVARDGQGNFSTGPVWCFTTLDLSPTVPSEPYPADSAEVEDLNIILSWSCNDPEGDSLTYDVYFGPTPYLSVVSSEQTENSYHPDALTGSTTYFWKIAARDRKGQLTNGPTWSFITANQPPEIPSNPNPPDGIEDHDLDITLSWSCSDSDHDTLSYDLYLGTSPIPSLFLNNLSDTTCRTGILDLITTYYWKITARDNYGHSATGPLWSFTTAQDMVVTFPDRYLELVVRQAINKLRGSIYVSDINRLRIFEAGSSNISNLTGMEYMTALSILEMPLNSIDDVMPLSRLTELKHLNLQNNDLRYISSFAGLTELDTLLLDTNRIWDISPLSEMIELKKLYLTNNEIRSISPLSELVELVELKMNNNRINDLSSLSRLVNLDLLQLSNNAIENLMPLTELTNLTTLLLDGNLIIDLAPLSSLNSLMNLDLSGNRFTDLSPLSNLTNLKVLKLADINRIRDIAPLSELDSLKELWLSNNRITDFAPLSTLTSLTDLWLDHNLISDLAPLDSMGQLKVLSLDENQISDLSPMTGLVKIRELHLDSNRISDIHPLILNSGMNRGDVLYIRHNPLSDTSIRQYCPQLQQRGVIIYR